MPPTRPELAVEIFDEAAELPPESRAAFLDQVCKDDPILRQEVEALLAADETAGAFLSDPQFNPADAAEKLGGDTPGGRIGHYKLVETIGEGGFGRVFLAEQERPVRRRVALKVIKLGMDTRQVIARFSAERQALAMMDHPNIARVLDAGATETGRPYFVMELVRGTPITRYCEQNRLTLAERLELFVQVCHAVQHAHQKGIIHRDLKPSNILITLLDGKPVPKIIDFGIAKATQQRLTEHSVHTGFHTLLGTPVYMSPEQATLSGDDVDTRSDVYSLGVILYELLTGTTPFDPKSLQNATYAEVQRLIHEIDPPKPSTRVWSLRDTVGHAAIISGPPSQLRSVLRGELDWIVMKCLEKQRSRRYDSASALAGDIVAYLRHKPVSAVPPSTVYRARKFVQQHAIAIGAGAAIVTAMAVGLVTAVLALQRLRVEQQRTLAEKQQAELSRQQAIAANETASAVNDFVNEMLASADPYQRGKSITVEQLLSEANESLGDRFAGRPLVEAGVRETIGRAYAGMGRSKDAVTQLELSLNMRKAQGVYDSPEFLVSRAELAIALHTSGDFQRSSALFREVIDAARRQLESPGKDTVRAVDVLARSATYMGVSSVDLEQLFAEATRRRVEVLGEDHPDTLSCKSAWSWYLALASDESPRKAPTDANLKLEADATRAAGYTRAEAILRETQSRMQRVLGVADRATLRNADRLARLLSVQGRLQEAIELTRQTAVDAEKVLGFEHPLTIAAYADYAETLKKAGQYDAALQIQQRRLDGLASVFGSDSAAVAGVASALGELYELTGDDERAMQWYRRRLAVVRKVNGVDSINVAFSEGLLAEKLAKRRQFVEATELIAHALPIMRKNVSAGSVRLADMTGLYARLLFEVGRSDDAIPYAQETISIVTPAWEKASLNSRTALARRTTSAAIIIARVRGPIAAEPVVRAALSQADEVLKPGTIHRELVDHLRQACEQTGRTEEAAGLSKRLHDLDAAIAVATSQPVASEKAD